MKRILRMTKTLFQMVKVVEWVNMCTFADVSLLRK